MDATLRTTNWWQTLWVAEREREGSCWKINLSRQHYCGVCEAKMHFCCDVVLMGYILWTTRSFHALGVPFYGASIDCAANRKTFDRKLARILLGHLLRRLAPDNVMQKRT